MPALQRHGWTLLAHPLFLDQLNRIIHAADRAKKSDPKNWRQNANAKTLTAIINLILNRIPNDPLAPEFRQGNTLGPENRHWFRAKFGQNRFRLFFRADTKAKVIVYAWVNDRDTLRKQGSATDPYAIFAKMLAAGTPPNDFPALLAAAQQFIISPDDLTTP